MSAYNLDDNVLFVGKTLFVNEWLNAMDIMVLPSRFEGLPNVLIEWQLSGLPCIVSSNVTTKVKLTNLVNFCELKIDDWVFEIMKKNNLNKCRNNLKNIKIIQNSGYDISIEAKKLIKEYQRLNLEKK